MKMIDHNHFICHLILGTFTEYPFLDFVVVGYYLLICHLTILYAVSVGL